MLIELATRILSLVEFMALSFITAMVINALYTAYHYEEVNGEVMQASKMVFWRIPYYFSKRISKFYMKPLFTCVWCMASVYSPFIYFPYYLSSYDLNLPIFLQFLIFVPLTSAFAGFISAKINDL